MARFSVFPFSLFTCENPNYDLRANGGIPSGGGYESI